MSCRCVVLLKLVVNVGQSVTCVTCVHGTTEIVKRPPAVTPAFEHYVNKGTKCFLQNTKKSTNTLIPTNHPSMHDHSQHSPQMFLAPQDESNPLVSTLPVWQEEQWEVDAEEEWVERDFVHYQRIAVRKAAKDALQELKLKGTKADMSVSITGVRQPASTAKLANSSRRGWVRNLSGTRVVATDVSLTPSDGSSSWMYGSGVVGGSEGGFGKGSGDRHHLPPMSYTDKAFARTVSLGGHDRDSRGHLYASGSMQHGSGAAASAAASAVAAAASAVAASAAADAALHALALAARSPRDKVLRSLPVVALEIHQRLGELFTNYRVRQAENQIEHVTHT